MPFYLRKSLNVGPFRFNLSKSGIGVSVGVKGFRFGTGPQGHYIHAGTGGFYYKTILRGKRSPSSAVVPTFRSPDLSPSPGVGPFVAVEAGDVSEMIDSDAASILRQINKSRSTPALWVIPGIISGILGALAALAITPANIAFFALAITTLAATAVVYRWDKIRRTTVLMYDMEDAALKIFEFFVREFEQLASAQKKLNIEAVGHVYDWKRHAGAGSEVKATPATYGFGVPRRIQTNISVPFISGGMNTVYFFPDLLIVEQKDGIGGVDYRKLNVEFRSQNWIESESVPTDSTRIGSTWQFVRRDGGPDRRFNNNRQLPILRYQVMLMLGPGNFAKVIYLSKSSDRARLSATISGLALLHGNRVISGGEESELDRRLALPQR
jgi:hypothetical protein